MTDEKELKDQRVPIMMTPSELEAIDDWMFENRIRSRGEAIRRLCQRGIVEEQQHELVKRYLADLIAPLARLPSLARTTAENNEVVAPIIASAVKLNLLLSRSAADLVTASIEDLIETYKGLPELLAEFSELEGRISNEDFLKAYKNMVDKRDAAAKAKLANTRDDGSDLPDPDKARPAKPAERSKRKRAIEL